MDDKEYEEKIAELEAELKPELTAKFLAILVKAVKTCGWSVDHIETINFVQWCYDVAGEKAPDYDKDLAPLIEEVGVLEAKV